MLRVPLILLLWLVAGLPGGLTLCMCWCPPECTAAANPCCEAEAPDCCDSNCSLELDSHPDPLALPPTQVEEEEVPQLAEVQAHVPFRATWRNHAPTTSKARPPPFAQRSPELRL